MSSAFETDIDGSGYIAGKFTFKVFLFDNLSLFMPKLNLFTN